MVEADAEHYAKNKTYAVTAHLVESKPPVVEQESAYDALHEIVGKTHLAYAFKAGNCLPHSGGVIKKYYSADIECHHGEIAPGVELNVKASAYTNRQLVDGNCEQQHLGHGKQQQGNSYCFLPKNEVV